MNEPDIAERYRIFLLQYKQFKIAGGGRPALLLAVGAPLTIIPLAAMAISSLNAWSLLAVILVNGALFAGLAGVWIWRDTQA